MGRVPYFGVGYVEAVNLHHLRLSQSVAARKEGKHLLKEIVMCTVYSLQ